jgi:hypothetical protein
MKRLASILALLAVAASGAWTVLHCNTRYPTMDLQYVWQAWSFLHGRLDLAKATVDAYSLMDVTVRGGKYYWPLGPLPSVLLMPFVLAFGQTARAQATLQVLLAAAVAALAYGVARRGGASRHDAAWLACAFCLGSVAIGVLAVDGPWQVAHAIVLVALLAAIHEWQGKKRPLVMGALVAAAIATRLTAGAGALFFVIALVRERGTGREGLRALATFLLPLALVALLLGAFNAARFGSPFDNGYADSTLTVGDAVWSRRAEHGLFSFANVPRNAWYYFVALPAFGRAGVGVDPQGLSFFLLSPAFLYAATRPKKDATWAAVGVVCAAALAAFMPYYTTGYVQFGPRYLNDVLPFLYLLLVDAVREERLRAPMKSLIAASAALNILLFAAFLHELLL